MENGDVTQQNGVSSSDGGAPMAVGGESDGGGAPMGAMETDEKVEAEPEEVKLWSTEKVWVNEYVDLKHKTENTLIKWLMFL